MAKIQFDPAEPGGAEIVRTVVLERLRAGRWNQILDHSNDTGFDPYVEFVGNTTLGKEKFGKFALDVLWQFTAQGIIAPGESATRPGLPWFHITEYGEKVLEKGEYLPHDPTKYLQRFKDEIGTPDPSVEAYLSESLNCFERGCLVASVMMLGIASERAFLLLCDALLNATANATEKADFEKVIKINAIKPKMDWVLNKITTIQNAKPRPLPDNVNIMLTAVFDFIRMQRNDIGHPKDVPPKTTREEAFANLNIFPRYYKMLNELIDWLSNNQV